MADLSSGRDVAREAALARLTVIGARAVIHLAGVAEDAARPTAARVASLRALEAIGDARAIDLAVRCMSDADKAVAVAGAGILQRFLGGTRAAHVTDVLTRTALDRRAGDAVRLAALVALQDLDVETLAPLWRALADDPSASVREHVADVRRGENREISSEDRGALSNDPDRLHQELSGGRVDATLAELQGLIERIRALEDSASAAQRPAWTRARGAAHIALAKRGSRVGLYDLRETIEQSQTALPVEFMAALSLVGDATCLEAVAAAYGHASTTQDEWWRDHLVDAFRAIVSREKITARHAVMKKIQKRWPSIISTI